MKKSDAVDAIKSYLVGSGYKPGDKIPTQPELSQELDISARTLRDGICVLVNQGFLIPRGRGGTYMSNPRRESVVEPIRWFYETKDVPDYDLIQARLILERAIIAETCANRLTKDLLLLQQIVDAQNEDDLSVLRELELDKEFHLQVVSSAHNKALDIVGNIILLQLDLLYERGLYPYNDHIRPTDHQKIIELIYNRDVDQAQSFISTHIERCCVIANASENNPLSPKPTVPEPQT